MSSAATGGLSPCHEVLNPFVPQNDIVVGVFHPNASTRLSGVHFQNLSVRSSYAAVPGPSGVKNVWFFVLVMRIGTRLLAGTATTKTAAAQAAIASAARRRLSDHSSAAAATIISPAAAQITPGMPTGSMPSTTSEQPHAAPRRSQK